MYIKEIISLIEDYAPLKLQASFDNSGLLCGDPERELTSILLCIDVTEEVVKEAIDKGHNLIISHQERIIQMADRIMVIEGGKIASIGQTADILPQLLGKTADSYSCLKCR